MRFNPGQNRKVVKGKTYIKDLPQIQSSPVKEIKEEIKEKSNESIQHEQVVQNPIPKGSQPVRRKVRSSSKSNRSGNSGS
tara:strand:+ start:440 stop:679 length:240 start_codon:yes stop_codon:yes gene_type:complete